MIDKIRGQQEDMKRVMIFHYYETSPTSESQALWLDKKRGGKELRNNGCCKKLMEHNNIKHNKAQI